MRRIVATCAVIVAVAFVTSVTVDLGPSLRQRAETAGTQVIKRPMHIGKLSVHLWRGSFVVSDLMIEGLTPQSRPFLVGEAHRRLDAVEHALQPPMVFDAIQMTDWEMYVELFPDGRHNFPKFPQGNGRPRAPGRRRWST